MPPRQISDGYLLHSEDALLKVAEQAVARAVALGASGASALANESSGITITVSDGAPSSSVRDGGQSLTITVFDNGRSGQASTEAIDEASVDRAVRHACTIASKVEPDADSGLADARWLARTGPDVAAFAPSDRSADELITLALEIEAAALNRQVAPGIRVRVSEATASSHDLRWARATSAGFARAASASIQSRACVAIADRDGAMVRDWWQASERREDSLPDSETIAREAVDRTVAKLGGRSVPTQTTPVLLDARMAASLVFDLVGGLTGAAQQQRSTFMVGALGTRRLAAHIDLLEDPFEPFGMSSFAWDSEGIAGSRRHIVRSGTIEGYFLDVRTARKLGMQPSGSADGPGNLTLTSSLTDPGDDLPAMLRKLDRGLWITQFLGGGVNPATGAYSKAVEGFWIENGEVVHPVQDMTVAGDLPAMFEGIVAVGADQLRQGSVRTGSILIDNMRIAGR
ncbi:metallopeptidase TldD-related protein [Sphingobium sp.]|uniref:TldD/PmbA family protein n=1 Tax=Sphingobium sp. TaxID=1912891 RepID=UPI0025FF9622|nr:metallopeptidase TldD-related protein [Sphingobium sp.]